VGADWRDRERLTAGCEHWPAGGQVVGAGAGTRGDDQAVARQRIQVLVVDVELEQRHLLPATGNDERVKDDVLDSPQRTHRLAVAFELDADGRVDAHVISALKHLLEACLPARRRDVCEKTELAEVDAEDGNLAVAARGAHDHAVPAEDDLHFRVTRLFGVDLALAQPGLHALAELDGLGLTGIGDDAQASRLGTEAR